MLAVYITPSWGNRGLSAAGGERILRRKAPQNDRRKQLLITEHGDSLKLVYITPSRGTGGNQPPGKSGSFVALRLLRMTEEVIGAQDDRGSFARCTLRAVDDRFYDRCYVNRVIFNS